MCCRCHEGTEWEWRYSSTQSQLQRKMEVSVPDAKFIVIQNPTEMLNISSLLRTATVSFPSSYPFHLSTPYLAFGLSFPEGRAGTTWEPSDQ